MQTRRTVNTLWWSPERVTYPSEGRRPSLTDPCGEKTEHLQYLPFGEEFIYQKSNAASITTVYTLNGKEKDLEMRSILAYYKVKIDNHAKLRSILAYHKVKINNHAKTGYNYYGARHYNASWGVPALSKAERWLSVDPLSDKYQSHSPYNYCMINPVMLVDPDGREIDEASEVHVKKYEGEINIRINHLRGLMSETEVGSDSYSQYKNEINTYIGILSEIKDLRDDKKNIYSIKFGVSFNSEGTRGSLTYGGNKDGKNLIHINLKAKEDMNLFNNLSTLAHEFKHAHQYFEGELGFALLPNGKQLNNNTKPNERQAFHRGAIFSGRMLSNGASSIKRIPEFNHLFKLDTHYDDLPDFFPAESAKSQ